MQPKQDKIKQLLREREIAGAIVSSPENFHYVTGFAGHQHTVSRQPGFSLAVMAAAEAVQTQITTMDFEVPTFQVKNTDFLLRKYDTWVGVKSWEEIKDGAVLPESGIFESSLDLLVRMVGDLGLADKKIGLELDYLPLTYYQAVCERLPQAEFVNISPLFVLARSVKTAEEIELFRQLCGVADEAFLAVSELVCVGVSERELCACFAQKVVASGVCMPSSWSMFSTGSNGARLGLPTDRRIADGDVVKFDAGVNAAFDFYTTDTSRAWLIGNADPVLARLKDRLYEGQRRMLALAKPGVPICALYHAGYDYVKEMFPSYRRGHMGHNISMGPATAEPPYINGTETRPLEAGMILAMEVPCYIGGVNGFNLEDMVLITETGCEVLTSKTPHYLKTEEVNG